MSCASLIRTHVLAVPSVLGALLAGACWSTPDAPGGTGGSNSRWNRRHQRRGRPAAASAAGTGGTNAVGTGGSTASCGAVGPTTGAPGFGAPAQAGTGTSAAKYFGADVTRDGVNYRFITNWWGPGWTTSDVSYSGTSFTVASAAGTSMPDGTPIGYPATYCGQYSESAAHGNCGLPAAYSTIDKLWTGWKWSSDRSRPVQRRLGHLARNGVGVSVVPDGLAARSSGATARGQQHDRQCHGGGRARHLEHPVRHA